MFFVYVIKNQLSGKIYIGQTKDLVTRLKRHNGLLPYKTTAFTHRNKGGWEIVYVEEYTIRVDAVRREKQLKSFRGREFVKLKIKAPP